MKTVEDRVNARVQGTINALKDMQFPRKKRKTRTEFWVVLQEGGSSAECYGTAYGSQTSANKAVASHERASYRAVKMHVVLAHPVTDDQMGEIAGLMAEAAGTFHNTLHMIHLKETQGSRYRR